MSGDPNRTLQAMTAMFEAGAALAEAYEKMSAAARSVGMPMSAVDLIEDFARQVAGLADLAGRYAKEIYDNHPADDTRH